MLFLHYYYCLAVYLCSFFLQSKQESGFSDMARSSISIIIIRIMIIVSNYMVEQLMKAKLIQPIDKSKLNIWDRLDSRLLEHYFDTRNEYSIPYSWGVYGLGIDKDFFGPNLPEPSWGLIFDPKIAP